MNLRRVLGIAAVLAVLALAVRMRSARGLDDALDGEL